MFVDCTAGRVGPNLPCADEAMTTSLLMPGYPDGILLFVGGAAVV